jgi:hypothetical protein
MAMVMMMKEKKKSRLVLMIMKAAIGCQLSVTVRTIDCGGKDLVSLFVCLGHLGPNAQSHSTKDEQDPREIGDKTFSANPVI